MDKRFRLNYIKCPECHNILDLSFVEGICPNPLCSFQFKDLSDWLDKDDVELHKAFVEAYKTKDVRAAKLLSVAIRYNIADILAHFISCNWGAHYNALYKDFLISYLDDLNALKLVLKSDTIKPDNSIVSKNGYKIYWELYERLIKIHNQETRNFLRLEFPSCYRRYYQLLQKKYKPDEQVDRQMRSPLGSFFICLRFNSGVKLNKPNYKYMSAAKKFNLSPQVRNYDDGIYYLRNSYDRVLNILDAVFSTDHIINNKALNLFYIGLMDGITYALNNNRYNDLKPYFFGHPDNILDISDELRIEWEELLRSKALNFMAQIEKRYIKINTLDSFYDDFNKTMAGIDIAIEHHRTIDIAATLKQEQGIMSGKKISYHYSGNLGRLEIKNFKAIEFKGVTSALLNYFYKIGAADDSYKTYRDFENSEKRLIKSSEFSKKIIAINKRTERETRGTIKKLIETAENEKRTETNRYRWTIDV